MLLFTQRKIKKNEKICIEIEQGIGGEGGRPDEGHIVGNGKACILKMNILKGKTRK